MNIDTICALLVPLLSFFSVSGSLGIQHVGKQFIKKLGKEIQLPESSFSATSPLSPAPGLHTNALLVQGSWHSNNQHQSFVKAILGILENLNGVLQWTLFDLIYNSHQLDDPLFKWNWRAHAAVAGAVWQHFVGHSPKAPCGCDSDLQTRHDMLDGKKHA